MFNGALEPAHAAFDWLVPASCALAMVGKTIANTVTTKSRLRLSNRVELQWKFMIRP
jgi:hypothetical protein